MEAGEYVPIPLVGGPKDGRAFLVPVSKDGSYKIRGGIEYTVAGGKKAFYVYSHKRGKYLYRESFPR
jgi:hypothetical protein